MSQNENKGNGKIAIVLIVALFIGIAVLVVALVSMSRDNKTEEPTLYNTTEGTVYAGNTTTENVQYYPGYVGSGDDIPTTTEVPDTTVGSHNNTQAGNQTTAADTGTAGETTFVEYYEQLSPNGDNKLSDNPDNEFIALIVEEYGVNPDLLVAIYSVPDTGVNYVIEFAGSRDSSGKIIKSPDTLSKLYYIDIQKNISVATPSGFGNEGVDAFEGKLTIELVKSIVMSQYPGYFTGV